jgi:hypothetical protein
MARIARAALVVAILASSFTVLSASSAFGASTVANAVNWLKTQQQTDGGFEVSGFPGFETADAIFAIAEAAQTGASWSATEARNAVLATTNGGHTPLDAIDDYVSGTIGAGQAGKVITLVTNPLGINPANFDPRGNGATNLVATLGVPGADGTFGIGLGAFNSFLYAVRGYARISSARVPTTTIDVIRSTQKIDGSWDFNGDNTGTGTDIDTTGLAILALLDAGVSAVDPDVGQGLGYLVAQQQATGAWQAFGSDDPNSTAVAMLALSAGGRTSPLAAADAFLAGLQLSSPPADAGRIQSPNDEFGVNTFATSQSIQALVRKAVSTPTSFTSVPAAAGGGALAIDTSAGALHDVVAVDPTTLATPPPGATFPSGLISFEVTGLAHGAAVTVHLFLPATTAATHYLKFNGRAWSDATSLAAFSGSVVTLTLADGGPGDTDGVQDGIITDPGGPTAVAASQTVAAFTG